MTETKRRGQNLCPHCDALAVIYTSRALSRLATEKYLQCTNLECGHQYVIHVGVVRTTVPSLLSRSDVSIPLVERRANDIVVSKGQAPASGQRDAPSAPPPPGDLPVPLQPRTQPQETSCQS